jgi:hypothetical protein
MEYYKVQSSQLFARIGRIMKGQDVLQKKKKKKNESSGCTLGPGVALPLVHVNIPRWDSSFCLWIAFAEIQTNAGAMRKIFFWRWIASYGLKERLYSATKWTC